MDYKHPCVFGPALWQVLHTAASAYNPREKENMKQVLINLSTLIPCGTCSSHYNSILRVVNLDLALVSKESLFKFTWWLHNQINIRLNKPWYSYEQASSLYKINGIYI